MHFLLRKEDWFLVTIFIAMSISIVLKSYFNINGYLSPDSSNYLASAQNLINGNGYFVSAYGLTGKDREFFAIWPVGYPTLIFLIAKVTGLSVFWASKVLNIVLIGAILGIFRSLFKDNAYIYGLIFFFSAYLEIFSYTWSETLFTFALIWFASSIYRIIESPKNGFLLFMFLMASSLLLFLSRYIGAFSFGLIGLLGLYYFFLKKNKVRAVILISISLVSIALMIGYLYHNYLETGFPTGMPRIPSPETNFQLFIMLIKALVFETVIPIQSFSKIGIVLFGIQFSVIGFLVWKHYQSIKDAMLSRHMTALTAIFAIVGLTYLFFIILMRWITQFDGYSYRLLGPGTFLLFMSLFTYILDISSEKGKKVFLSFLLVFSILSFLLNVPVKILVKYGQNNMTYNDTKHNTIDIYSKVENNSIVVFGPIHLKYLRTDIELRQPFALPYRDHKENWTDFLNRIDPIHTNNIYIMVPEKIDPKRFDSSVVDFVEPHKNNILVKIQ